MFIKNLPPRVKKGRAEEEFSNNCPALNWRNRGRPTCGEASINSLSPRKPWRDGFRITNKNLSKEQSDFFIVKKKVYFHNYIHTT